MKVGILGTRGIPPKYGGFETLADELGKGLAEKGHQVVVYGRTGYGQPRRAKFGKNLTAIRVPALRLRSTESLTSGLFSAAHAAFIERPDVVLVCNPSNVWALKLLKAFGIPGILHVAGLEPHRIKWKGLGAIVLGAAVKSAVGSSLPLMTDSDAVADWYKKRFGRDLAVVKYGARKPISNPSLLQKFDLASKTYDLIVARWDEDNQVAEMIEAHRNSGTNTRLVVVGDDKRNTDYGNKIRQAIFEHPGAVGVGSIWSQEVLGALYAGSRCYLHGHSSGGTNPALLIGATSGAEVLVHQNPFNMEVVGDKAWPWNDQSDLINILKSTPWAKKAKAEALVDRVSKNYVWSQIVSDYEKLLGKILMLD